MSAINLANIKKTVYYLKRNGFSNTFWAVLERVRDNRKHDYTLATLSMQTVEAQKKQAMLLSDVKISIVVPMYRTPVEYMKEMIESVLCQTYPKWELILADATEDDSVKREVEKYSDSRIQYIHLDENAGISVNTNKGIAEASGDYIGLLDHDDVLTQNALFEMAQAIETENKKGHQVQMLYSDEDKGNGDLSEYYEPNFKEKFNLDLLLTNNYICHFLVMRSDLMKKLLLRKEFDGAQDFDLVLRAADLLCGNPKQIVHIPKVLYHWRCHPGSTAENPQSKMYAYEAGKRAIEDWTDKRGWKVTVENTMHLGFYRLHYRENPLAMRKELGAIGGPVVHRGKIIGGRMDEDGKIYYENLPIKFSGYLHRAILQQDAEVLDIRNIELAPGLRYLTKELFGVEYQSCKNSGMFDYTILPENRSLLQDSKILSEAIRSQGYTLLYLPDRKRRV